MLKDDDYRRIEEGYIEAGKESEETGPPSPEIAATSLSVHTMDERLVRGTRHGLSDWHGNGTLGQLLAHSPHMNLLIPPLLWTK
jgi:hypothetical protein